jgi:uncharacterized protein (TIGR02270 family)
VIPVVVRQHAEEAAILRGMRSVLTNAPHVKLHQLRRLDDRLAAHLDGLAVAGVFGWRACESALETPGVGELFVATVRAVEDRNDTGLDKLLAVAETLAESRAGLISALGWTSASKLQGISSAQLAHGVPFRRKVGIATCALHRVDPGTALNAAIMSPNAALRARALRCAGEIGRREMLPDCVEHLRDENGVCAFWAAWSSVVLGDRGRAVQWLRQVSPAADSGRERALDLVLMLSNSEDSQSLLKTLVHNPANDRAAIRGSGVTGNQVFVPWLISQMRDNRVARIAGEAFSLITGADLALLDLECRPPEGVETGPNDDPADPNVAMDEDDGLPWPDQGRVQGWWNANSHHFQSGGRYLLGEPVSRENCMRVLKDGYQRQRILAAHYLCLLNPGTPLFNTSAPAWRQQRLLAKMS